jgi:multicomponent Na+:H+ antiporter subunit D
VEFAQSLALLTPLAVVAAVTGVRGSWRALFGPVGTSGGLVHLGIMNITLFFCAGNDAETLGIRQVSEMNGAGRRMPWSTAAFSIAALGCSHPSLPPPPCSAPDCSPTWSGVPSPGPG